MKVFIVPTLILVFIGVVLINMIVQSQIIFEPEFQPDEIVPYGMMSFDVFAFIKVWFTCLLCCSIAFVALIAKK